MREVTEEEVDEIDYKLLCHVQDVHRGGTCPPRCFDRELKEVVRLTTGLLISDDGYTEIARRMNEHFRAHAISNNINSMSCDVSCRTRQFHMVLNGVIEKEDD